MIEALICIMSFGFLLGFMLNSHFQREAERKHRENHDHD